MGDLGQDTSVEEVEGGIQVGTVPPEWDGFGPNGGYLAAMSLRAAAVPVRVRTPRVVQSQFLRPGSHGKISFTPSLLGRSTRSDIVYVTAAQQGNAVLATFARTLQASACCIARITARVPDVPDPDFLRPTEELLPPEMLHLVPITRQFEVRPVTWERTWPPPQGRNPAYLAWCRFRPTATFDDPFVSVGRYLVLLDSYVWAAVERGTCGGSGLYARSTDLSVTIDDPGQSEEWLLADVVVPVMRDGAISATGSIWSRDGSRLATGAMNMVYAPIRE
jgi:acyl-CoA thioesterase